MITPFWCPVLRCLCRDLSGRKALGSPVPFDTECCFLSVDGSCEPAVEESPVKCGWGLHVVRARSVLGQFCGPIVCSLLRENTRVFKLSNNLAELVALVHALEFVLSQPSSLNFKVCFDSKYAAHVVQLSWQAKSHLEVVRFAGELHRCCDLHAQVCWHWVRCHSRDLGNDAADALAKAGARGTGTTGENADRVMWKPCFVRVCSTFAVNLGTVCAAVSLLHASAVGCASLGFPAGLCSDFLCDVQVFPFQAVVGCMSHHDSQQLVRCLRVVNPWCALHGGSAGGVSRGRDAGRDSEE